MRILLANFSKMVDDTGGAAKVHCAFANEMERRGHIVAMMYCDDKVGKPFFKISKNIKVYNLQHLYGRNILFPKWLKVKRELIRAVSVRRGRAVNDEFIERYLTDTVQRALAEFNPDIIITWQPSASKTFLCDIQTGIPVITMSHGDPEDYFRTYPQEELPAIGKSAVCQVLMPSFTRAITSRYPDMRTEIIGNVVPQYEEQADLAKEKAIYKIIFVGRLVKNHKRPHLLIEAFAKLANEFPNWNVEIWGAEDKKNYTDSMKQLIKKENLQDRIFLKGTTHNIAQVLQKGDLFVFPSAYEGFGLSIAEAMSMGLPVIGYKNCAAVNELIQDGVSGFLADDGVDSLADKMKVLMSDQLTRRTMGDAARNAMKQFKADHIWDKWSVLLNTVLAKKIKDNK